MMLGQCISDFAMSHGLPVSLFLAGLMGGFTHCSGMCAPFVLAQSSDKPFSLRKMGSALLLPYHLGRMTTYVLLALVLGSFVNLAYLFSPEKAMISAPLLMLAGVLFLVSAFPKLGYVFPWAVKFQVTKPFQFIVHLSGKLMNSQSAMGRYGLGVLLGFMPCGLVVSALLAAGSAGSALDAGLAMAAFALGTMPALMLVGLGGHAVKYKYPQIQMRLSQGAMVISSAWLFALAGTLIF